MSSICYSACVTILILELIKFLIPDDNNAGKFVMASTYILILASVTISVFSLGFSDLIPSDLNNMMTDTENKVSSIFSESAGAQLENKIENFLSEQKISCKSVDALISSDGKYEVKSIYIRLNYSADTERTKILLTSLLGEEEMSEVTVSE